MNDFYNKQVAKYGYWWSGDYFSWEEANRECIGYDQMFITEQVKHSILLTKDNPNKYERDGVIIDGQPTYAFEILDWLKKTALDKNIDLIDFGGSLGTTYFQLKPYLNSYSINWNVVEQKHIVDVGNDTFSNNELKFYYNIEDVLKENNSYIFLSSSALPYIDKVDEIIDIIMNKNFDYIIFDRISVIENSDKDRLTIQIVPPQVYSTIYPCWFFGENKFVNMFTSNNYIHLKTFDALGGNNFAPNISNSYYKGFVFKKIK